MVLPLPAQVADAVVSELNDASRTWYPQITATRSWFAEYRPADLQTLKVSVIPVQKTHEQATRAQDRLTVALAIDFQKTVADPFDRQAMDDLTKLVEDVEEWFKDSHFFSSPMNEWFCEMASLGFTEDGEIYSYDLLDGESCFRSMIRLDVASEQAE